MNTRQRLLRPSSNKSICCRISIAEGFVLRFKSIYSCSTRFFERDEKILTKRVLLCYVNENTITSFLSYTRTSCLQSCESTDYFTRRNKCDTPFSVFMKEWTPPFDSV